MRIFSFFLVGTLFGVILTKSEVISWFRIHEMFRFESFHMFGIIGTAVLLGALLMAAMKRFKIKTLRNTLVSYKAKELSVRRHLIAGSIFGLGWALVGACPGPIFALIGQGFGIFALVLLSATIGAFTYGATRHRLPH